MVFLSLSAHSVCIFYHLIHTSSSDWLFPKYYNLTEAALFYKVVQAMYTWNNLVSLIFSKRSLVFPIRLFSSISLHCSLSYLSLLFFGTLLSEGYISFIFCFAFHFSSFLSYFKASSDNHFAFLHFFFCGWFWWPPSVQCYEAASIVLQALYQI